MFPLHSLPFKEAPVTFSRAVVAVLALSAVLTGAACSSRHELATCKGPLIALNAAYWTPTPAELVSLEAACPEGR